MTKTSRCIISKVRTFLAVRIHRTILALCFMGCWHVSVADNYSQVGLPITQVFGPGEHGGHNQNWSSIQVDNGIVYVGHTTGISAWDGERWRNYPTPQNTPVRNICPWRDGRLYVGTTDDIGYFSANATGELEYHTLLTDWTFEQKQFGQVWSATANDYGIAFVTDEALFFWDGRSMQRIDSLAGHYRLFTVDNDFYFKPRAEAALYKIKTQRVGYKTRLHSRRTELLVPAGSRVLQVLRNRNGNLTVATSADGLYEQNGTQLVQRRLAADFGTNVALYHTIQARDGYYYTTSLHDGLYILNESFDIVRHYDEDHGLGMSAIYSAYEDRQNNLWLTGVPNVIKLVPPHRISRFTAGNASTEIMRLSRYGDSILAIGNGLFQLDAPEPGYAPPAFSPILPTRDIHVDAVVYADHLVYSGLDGVFAIAAGERNVVPHQLVQAGLARALHVHPVTGSLLATSERGLFQIARNDDAWSVNFVEGTKDELDTMTINAQGEIWIGTATQEAYRIKLDATTTPNIEKFGPSDGLPPGDIRPVHVEGSPVFASDRGVFAYRPDQQPAFTTATGFPSAWNVDAGNFLTLHQDTNARLWYQVDDKNGYLTRATELNWIDHNTLFKPFVGSKLTSVLSENESVVWFVLNHADIYRTNLAYAESLPPVADLNIRRVINLVAGESLGGNVVDKLARTLDQNSNSLRFYFALTDSSTHGATQYRHRLTGQGSASWSNWSHEDLKDYHQLSGGSYRFDVQAQDTWGRTPEASITFVVQPPWYLTRWALVVWALTGIALLVLSGWVTQQWRTRRIRAQNVELEKTVADRTRDVQSKVEELRQQQVQKDRFFGNVSHEFRTPLTLTIGPLELVATEHAERLDNTTRQLVNTALNNARRMLALVGQVLDLNRLEAGKLPLRVSHYDAADMMIRIKDRFTQWAQQHEQTLQCENCDEIVEMWFDQDQLDKCVSNLVANAIKYSGHGSEIVLRLLHEETRTGLQVRDNGVGIQVADQDKVFKRFFQTHASEQVAQPGTGIGLALVKEIIELHGGAVTLDSTPGNGCCFTLWLPNGKAHCNAEQLIEPIALTTSKPENYSLAGSDALELANEDERDVTTLLVVDDNQELRNFISLRLSATYRILQASNGQEGFELARTALPDLVISDVMMPVMSGTQLARKLKSSVETRTIPLILLTAKATKRETVEGFESGADDYLTKPFDTSELNVRVNALIASRKLIRESLQLERSASAVGVAAKTPFATKLDSVLQSYLGHPGLNVKRLAELLHTSTDTLTRKCKKLTGQTPLEYLTRLRMEHALILLKNQDLTVSEIGYSLGYESLAYFSRRFKQHTGHSPTDYQCLPPD